MENTKFDNDTQNVPIPMYFKLQTKLLQEIENGRWKPGEKIPTEKDLCEGYKLSIGTVRRAISNLVTGGYLQRFQGRGTFVAGKSLRDEELNCPYFHFRKDLREQESEITVKFLDLNIVDSFAPASLFLNQKANQRLLELGRIYYMGNKPIAYNVCYLPQKMFRDFEKYHATLFEEMPLCNILEEKYGKPSLSKHELFGVTQADAQVASLLKIQVGTPLLFIEMVAFTYKEIPFEYRRSYCVTTDKKVFRKT